MRRIQSARRREIAGDQRMQRRIPGQPVGCVVVFPQAEPDRVEQLA
jgi:hypothetical protein